MLEQKIIKIPPQKTHYQIKFSFFFTEVLIYCGREGRKRLNKSCILTRAQALTWTFLSRTPCAARWNVIRCQGGDHMTHKWMTSAWSSVGDDPEVIQMHRAPIHHICRDALMTWTTLTMTSLRGTGDLRFLTHLNFILIKKQQNIQTHVWLHT